MKTTKHSLLMSAIALLLCASMLIGTTFAWFTDTVTSSGNKIQSGTLKVDLELLENKVGGEWISLKEVETKLFDYNKWEPGYTEIKILRVQNEGTLALKWVAQFVSDVELSKLADVIDVYVNTTVTAYPTDRNDLTGWTHAGTVAEFVNTIATTTKGTLLANDGNEGSGPDEAYLGIALKMQETANNDYQDLDLGGAFDIVIYATQLNSEKDSIDENYDVDSVYPTVSSVTVPAGRTEDVVMTSGAVDLGIPTNAQPGDYELYVQNSAVTTDGDGNSIAHFDIELTRDGEKVEKEEGVEYTITVKIAVGIDADTVKVYHNGAEIDSSKISSINPGEGTVTFKTDSFSPYAIAYKVDEDMHIYSEKNLGSDKNTFYVFDAEGFETLNKWMGDKSAGQYAAVKLCANIDMEDRTWTPVDSHADTKFWLAEFDGQGFTISNLTINGQAMFKRFAGSGDVTIKDVTFNNATVTSNAINTSILTVQTYQNVLLDNVDVANSTITGGYKVAPLIATVYNENSATTITATLKNCDVKDTTVTATSYDFCTTGMVAFVYADDNDKIEFENCTVSNVKLYAPNVYTAHAAIYTTGSETLFDEAEGVTVSNVTFENIQ